MFDDGRSSSGMASPPTEHTISAAPAIKRKANVAGLVDGQPKPVKRRASKACKVCRSRKVRCNVVEQGPPCTNCRLDEVECILTESKRQRKPLPRLDPPSRNLQLWQPNGKPIGLSNEIPMISPSRSSGQDHDEHVPHSLYRTHSHRHSASDHRPSVSSMANESILPNPSNQFHNPHRQPIPSRFPVMLPAFVTPLPACIGRDEVEFLEKKNALSVPDTALRNEILRCYTEFVQPFTPVLDLHDFLDIIERGDGSTGKISLLLYQAVMFAGSAFVDMRYLRRIGYHKRKEARKAFYHRARLLYDFDYETDRLALVQALVLMTIWYETPNDEKDTWHWIGVAVSCAQNIGLHRNPARCSSMDLKRRRLRKRIWWSCVVRDRLISLGMRRPTHIKAEDSEVPMLTLDDFEISIIPTAVTCLPPTCTLARDVTLQRNMALMTIELAKLCECINHIITAQYSIDPETVEAVSPDGIAATMATLAPKLELETSEVKTCHDELQTWLSRLPSVASLELPHQHSVNRSDAPIVLVRAMLHLVYYTALSALHRPQISPEAPAGRQAGSAGAIIEMSQDNVRLAAQEISAIASNLLDLDLARFLPTTGNTTLQPAIIYYLVELKSPNEEARRTALRHICQCLQVMNQFRDIYSAADYTVALFEAAIRKADISVPRDADTDSQVRALSSDDLIAAGVRLNLVKPVAHPHPALTPPPEATEMRVGVGVDALVDAEVVTRLENYLASTPPDSDHYDARELGGGRAAFLDFERDFDSLVNVDDFTDAFAFDDGGFTSMQGESSGLLFDMDWMTPLRDGGASRGEPVETASLDGVVLQS